MKLLKSEQEMTFDNMQLINKLKQGKKVVYTHLALERILYLENQINELKGALKDNVDIKRTNQSL